MPVFTTPTPRDCRGLEPVPYPDPDIVALDPASAATSSSTPAILPGSCTSRSWAEGPARAIPAATWCGATFPPTHRGCAGSEDDGRVTTFKGYVGLQQQQHLRLRRRVSCRRGHRVARYGSTHHRHRDRRASFQGEALLNSQTMWSCIGGPAASGSTTDQAGIRETTKASRRIGNQEAVYRVDGHAGQLEKVTDEVGQPNGLCSASLASTSPTRAPARSRCGTWTATHCAAASGSDDSPFEHQDSLGGRRHPRRRRQRHLGWRRGRAF